MDTTQQVILRMQRWVSDFIVDLNICPFALREVRRQSIHYQVCERPGDDALYDAVSDELRFLTEHPEIETTLLILPHLDNDFEVFLNNAGLAQQVIALNNLTGTFQLANFHPHYVFADSQAGVEPTERISLDDELSQGEQASNCGQDAADYTNRAPHAALHLLREDSVARAIHAHKNAELIPQVNVQRLRQLGIANMQQRFAAIRDLSD